MMRCQSNHDSAYYVIGEYGTVPYCSKCRDINKHRALPEMDILIYVVEENYEQNPF